MLIGVLKKQCNLFNYMTNVLNFQFYGKKKFVVGKSHLAGPAVPVGGGTGQEMVAGDQAPTPAAGAAATAECPVQIKDNGKSRITQ